MWPWRQSLFIPHTQDMATICYCLLGRKIKGTAERPLEAGIPSCPSHRHTSAQNLQDSLVSSLAVMFPLPMIFKSLLFQLYHRVSLSVYTCVYITLSGSLINSLFSQFSEVLVYKITAGIGLVTQWSISPGGKWYWVPMSLWSWHLN